MVDFASKIPFTMPLSAKKKQKYHLFSPSVSCARLSKVQSLLKTDGLDGILCILGIDSRYNSGTRQLLNYLLFGFCNVSANSISVRLTDEVLEDVIVFVKHGSVDVYCNPINYNYLLPYIAHWRNLHLHCLAKDEDDEEKAEEFKILSFISMVKGCEKIGIPYGYDSTQKPFDTFVVEKWPLVQAFALEGFGGGGFFTMIHEVVDVTSSLDAVYGMVDPVSFEKLITERLPLFERHCKSVLSNVDVESGTWESLSKITESLIGEPLISYYKHGHMSDSPANHSDSTEKPFCLFGVNTRKECLDKAKNGILSNKNTAVSTTGTAGSPARHMVCCAKDPKGTLSSIRTYFFGNGFLPCTGESEDSTKTLSQSKDLRLLIELYLITVDALLDGVKSFVQTQDIHQAKSAVDACIKSNLTKKNISLNVKNVKFSIEGHDFLGRNVSLETNKYAQCLKTASVFFYDVPSVERPGTVLGSVAFGETFLDSAVKIIDQDNEIPWNTQYVVITENVSRFTSWQGENRERKVTNQLEVIAKSDKESPSLGKQLVHGDVGIFAGQSLYSTYDEVTLYIYEKGFLFIHPRFGPVLIPLSALSNMHFYDKESSSSAALLILTYQPSLVGDLPCHLVNDSHRIVLIVSPRTKIFRQFYSDVLHLWKDENSQPQLQLISELPEDLMRVHSHTKENNKVALPADSKQAFMSLPQMKSFVPHIILSNANNIPMLPKNVDTAVGKPSLDQDENNNLELLVTILTGLPGSGKDQLCNTLIALAKENSKWIVLKSPLNNAQPFDANVLQASLTNTVASQKKLLVRMSSGRKQVRVILVTPGFTDIVDVIQAIYSHPKPEVKNHIKIGAVTCCVDPDNMFMEERYILPKLLDQCAQGWVNNVVFTSCLDPQNEQLAMVQKMIRACNPDAAFILAKGGEATRSSDVELILSDSSFTHDSAVQKRHIMCPGWSLGIFNAGPCEPAVSEICINLFGPLDKNLFIKRLKALQEPLHLKDCVSTSTFYSVRGHIHFVDHNTITEVHWTRLNCRLNMTTVDVSAMPRPPPKATQNGSIDENVSSYFIVFTGFSLQEDILKDWLRSCCRPKPQKKPLKSLKDLTKKELDQISAKHKCDALPEGWFYNGTTYVNLTGEKSTHHPLLDNFIKEHLTGVNEGITKHNASITNTTDVDIFQRQ